MTSDSLAPARTLRDNVRRDTGFARLLTWLRSSWNWKSALLSSCGRAAVFFAANLDAGLAAAIAAGRTEFLYRAIAAGFYGALTARLARLQPAWVGTWSALVLLPAIAHTVEYTVHRLAGTANAGEAVLASIAVSVATTRVNVFAMRRGLFLTGARHQSLRHDVVELARLTARACRRLWPSS